MKALWNNASPAIRIFLIITFILAAAGLLRLIAILKKGGSLQELFKNASAYDLTLTEGPTPGT